MLLLVSRHAFTLPFYYLSENRQALDLHIYLDRKLIDHPRLHRREFFVGKEKPLGIAALVRNGFAVKNVAKGGFFWGELTDEDPPPSNSQRPRHYYYLDAVAGSA